MMSNNISQVTFVCATASFVILTVCSQASASDAVKQQAKENFMKSDVNQDLMLNFQEFKSFANLNAQHGIGRFDQVRRFGMYDRAFNKIDADQNGLITNLELRAMNAQQR